MGPQARAGLRQPPHYAYSPGKHGDSLPLLLGSSRTAAAASQTGPDDLAAELNPHETDLNPHGISLRSESSVKPSAQPTLVRTQHLPPPAKTAR